MPIQNDSLNRKLYELLNSRGYNPIPRDSDVAKAGKTVPPEEADVFKFTFKQGNEDIGDAWVSIDGSQNLTLYYDQDIGSKAGTSSEGSEFDDSWYGLLRHLKKWAHARQLSFKLEPKEKIDSDMAQRTYMKKKEQIAEGYYPMGKSASYNDNIPSVKIILQHTRQIQEGEQRYRNIAKIFLENTEGERILAPTKKPGLAQIYARHLAEGGVPNDDRWNHIKGLCEEYSKMAGFVRAVRGNQFNESAQKLVEAGLNHYQSLRESLSKMRGHRGYNTYFESWTPTLMETEGDETNLNELFVQETLDPRIESVMPILSRLKLNLGEMKEVNELAEWVDQLSEAPGAETLAHNQNTEKSNLKAFGLAEDDLQEPAIEELDEEAMEESGLQAYLGNKKYGKEGMDALRKAGRDHASKEKMAKIRAKYDKLDEEGVEELDELSVNTLSSYGKKAGKDADRHDAKSNKHQEIAFNKYNKGGASADSAFAHQDKAEHHAAKANKRIAGIDRAVSKLDKKFSQGVAEGSDNLNYIGNCTDDDVIEHIFGDATGFAQAVEEYGDEFVLDDLVVKYDPETDVHSFYYKKQGVAEGLDPEKRSRLDDLISQYQDATDPNDYYDRDYDDPDEVINIIRQEFGDKIAGQVEAGADKMHFGRHDIQRDDPLRWKKGDHRVTKAGKLFKQDSDFMKNTIKSRYKLSGKSATEGVEEGALDTLKKVGKKVLDKLAPSDEELLKQLQKSAGIPKHAQHGKPRMAVPNDEVSEDLDANQKRAGQLGPTEKVGPKGAVGKLVGTSENFINTDAQAVVTEMEKDVKEGSTSKEKQKTPYRDINSPEYSSAAEKQKEKMAKDKAAEPGKKLLDKIEKKDVKEGQEDLDAILRIIKK